MKTRIVKPRYELWSYDGKEQSVETVSRENVLAIDRQSVDHFLAVDFGIWGFRTADGRWIEYDLSQKSLGKILFKILDVVRCEPGEYFTPEDVEEMTGIFNLGKKNNLSARWRALRQAHLESYPHPHFFLSKRTGGLGVGWHRARSFLQVSRIRPEQPDVGPQGPKN
ncbi:hypothetical protein ACFL6U_12210 [Planctomycetota bacterium]